MVARRIVLEFPPKESFRILVKSESLYGIWEALFANFYMTMLSKVKERLIFEAYFNFSPSVSVDFCFSDPARSIKWTLEDLVFFNLFSLDKIFKVKIEWDLEEIILLLVSAMALFLIPFCSRLIISSLFSTVISVKF